MNKLLVFICSYNYSPYIDRCIESILNQTYKDFELIIIDDGSTDDSVKILQKYSSNHKIKIIFYDKNKGVELVHNHMFSLMRKSSLEYVTFLGIDDFWEENFFKDSIESLQNFKEAAFSLSLLKKIDANEKLLSYPYMPIDYNGIKFQNPQKIEKIINMEGHFFWGNAVVIRKKKLINLFDTVKLDIEKLGPYHDSTYLIFLALKNGITTIPKFHVNWRFFNNSYSSKNSIETLRRKKYYIKQLITIIRNHEINYNKCLDTHIKIIKVGYYLENTLLKLQHNFFGKHFFSNKIFYKIYGIIYKLFKLHLFKKKFFLKLNKRFKFYMFVKKIIFFDK